MSDIKPTLDTIKKIKKHARHLSKKKSISQNEALNLIALKYGFKSWNELLESNSKTEKPANKVTLQEYIQDPEFNYEDIVLSDLDGVSGVFKNADGRICFDKKITIAQYIDKPFTSYKKFKNGIDKDLRNIHRAYPKTLCHVVKIIISSWTYELLDNPEKFIRQVIKRHPWLSFLVISVGPYTPEEMRQSALDGFPDEIVEIFKTSQLVELEYISFIEDISEEKSK